MSHRAYEFKPHEKPFMAGSPANPDHPLRRKICYGLIGVLIGLTAGATNGLLIASLAQMQGSLGLTPQEGGWVQVTYYMFNASMSVLMFKIRQHFGLSRFMRVLMFGLVASNILQFAFHSYHTELLARAMSGLVCSGLTSLAMYYMMQAMPAAHRIKGLFLGLGITQLALPMAHVISPLLLHHEDFHLLFGLQAGMALLSVAAVWALPIPPSFTIKAFEKTDLITFPFLFAGVAMICAAATQGRIIWWDKPEIGVYLAIGFVCLFAVVVIEYNRKNPMLNIRWIMSARGMLQVAVFAALIRITLSEQSIGAAGLLGTVGMGADQMVHFYTVTSVGAILGIVVSGLTFKVTEVKLPVVISFGLVALASFMEVGSGSMSRPVNFYLPEFMIAFASLYFFGPIMIEGILRATVKGPAYIMSFSAVFAFSQTVGGLIGVAVLNAFLTFRTRAHLIDSAAGMQMTDPVLSHALQTSAAQYSAYTADAAQASALAASKVMGSETLAAQISAYNELFLLIGLLALGGFLVAGMQWSWHKYHGTNPIGRELKAIAAQRAAAEAAAAKQA